MTAHRRRPHQEEEETERNYKSTIGKVRGRQDFNELGLKRMLLSYNIIKGGRDGRRRSFMCHQPAKRNTLSLCELETYILLWTNSTRTVIELFE